MINLFALLLSLLWVESAHAKTLQVRDTESFAQVLDTAAGGDILQLSGAEPYSILIKGKTFDPPIIIESADPAQQAMIERLQVLKSSGVTIRDIDIRSPAKTVRETGQLIMIIECENVRLTKINMIGNGKEYLTPANKAYALAQSLMLIRWSKGVTIEDSKISGFSQGIAILESTDVTIVGNELTAMQGDGIRMGGVQRIEIKDNRIHDFLGSDQSLNHSDMIQLWSSNAELVSSDIVIAHNYLLSGNGTATQSIFLRNEQADHDPANNIGRYYQRIRIVDNLIHNGHVHGITVGETNGLDILNNTLLPNPQSVMGSGDKRVTMIPTIRVVKTSTDVKIKSNVVVEIASTIAEPARENYILPKEQNLRDSQLKKLYHAQTFSGRLTDEDYKLRPGNSVFERKLGSSLSF